MHFMRKAATSHITQSGCCARQDKTSLEVICGTTVSSTVSRSEHNAHSVNRTKPPDNWFGMIAIFVRIEWTIISVTPRNINLNNTRDETRHKALTERRAVYGVTAREKKNLSLLAPGISDCIISSSWASWLLCVYSKFAFESVDGCESMRFCVAQQWKLNGNLWTWTEFIGSRDQQTKQITITIFLKKFQQFFNSTFLFRSWSRFFKRNKQ